MLTSRWPQWTLSSEAQMTGAGGCPESPLKHDPWLEARNRRLRKLPRSCIFGWDWAPSGWDGPRLYFPIKALSLSPRAGLRLRRHQPAAASFTWRGNQLSSFFTPKLCLHVTYFCSGAQFSAGTMCRYFLANFPISPLFLDRRWSESSKTKVGVADHVN